MRSRRGSKVGVLNTVPGIGSNGTLQTISHYEGVLGTTAEFRIMAQTRDVCERAEQAALGEIDRLELIFSTFRQQSELSRWQQTIETTVNTSKELADLLGQAEKWRSVTGGAFHPAVEAFTRCWRVAEQIDKVPCEWELSKTAESLVGPLWEVDSFQLTAKRLKDVPITLNSLAKGFIADAACTAAASLDGVAEAMVNIGGDLRHIGSGSCLAAIADPTTLVDNAVPLTVIRLHGCGMATSGGNRRGFHVSGHWYSHIIDPRTGKPTDHHLSATVVAPTAADADALATALAVLPTEHGIQLIDSIPDTACLIVEKSGRIHKSRVWKQTFHCKRE